MNNDINEKLPDHDIIKNTYCSFYKNIKDYLLLSYIIMFPVFLMSLALPINIEPDAPLSSTVVSYLILVALLIIVFTILMLRLYTLDRTSLYKIKFVDFISIFIKTFFYYIALYTVFILAILSVILLFGLVISVINSFAGEAGLDNTIIAIIVRFFTLLFLTLIALRVMPTFVSIAIKDNFLPMKSAYYFTRDNNKRLIWIGIASTLPTLLIVNQLSIFAAHINSLIFYLLSPLSLTPYALLLAAGSEIYKHLFAHADIKHNQFMINQANE